MVLRGTYTYPAAGAALPHAVMSVSGGTLSTTFTYDQVGNETAGLGRYITYTSYNKQASITQGASAIFFSHDPNHERFKQNAPEGVTLYFDVFGIHAELFQAATSQWNEYLMAGDGVVGVRFERSDATVSTRYFNLDHLGSISVITDENALPVERLAYDAWGKRRFPNGTDDPSNSITSQTSRGFTGQEMLADVGLVHLNGRIYDPLVARMLSADPFVPDPMNAQAWNRYSYVINNPLSITDPNGYCFLGLCSVFKGIGHLFTNLFHGLQNLLRSVPILGNIIQIAATAVCVASIACAPFAPLVAAASATLVSGVTSGNLGIALKSGLIAGATALAFNVVGTLTSGSALANIAGHALVGCASSVASGGSCKSGALSAGVTSAAGPLINDPNGFNPASLAGNAVLGGLASVAGGGKFANGAVAGAFGYLFNALAHVNRALLGTDAHQTLQRFVDGLPGIFVESSSDGLGTTFWGRVDIGNRDTQELWEIKPDNAVSIFLGRVQLEFYVLSQSSSGFPGAGLSYGVGGIPPWLPTTPLVGKYGAYQYEYAGDGVITWNQTKMNPGFILVPLPGKRKFGPPILAGP